MDSNEKSPEVLAGTTGEQEKNSEQAAFVSPGSETRKHSAPVLPTAPEPLPWSSSFKLGPDGVYKVEINEGEDPIDIWAFSPLIVEGRTRDEYGRNWGCCSPFRRRKANGTNGICPRKCWAATEQPFGKCCLPWAYA